VSETVEYFEDIDIGDEIAELEICPTTADVVRFVGVARMQSGRFTDDAYARQEGLPGAIVPGNMSLGFLSRMLTDFFPAGTLKELTANFRATVPHNTPLTCSGVVTEKQTRDGEHVIFWDVVLSNEEGERYVQGTALVALPARAA
jgi:acyl dehydratase